MQRETAHVVTQETRTNAENDPKKTKPGITKEEKRQTNKLEQNENS